MRGGETLAGDWRRRRVTVRFGKDAENRTLAHACWQEAVVGIFAFKAEEVRWDPCN